MKKFLAALTALVLAWALCACGGQSSAPAGGTPDPQPQSQDVQAPESNASDGPAAPVDSGNAPEEKEAGDPAAMDSAQAPEAEGPAESGGAEQSEDPVATSPVQTQPVQTQPAEAPAPAPAAPEEKPAAPAEKPAAPEEKPAADPKETAMGLVGRPVSELYAAIGQPVSSDYAPSCLVEGGEDGELAYNGFTVYTVKDSSGETVYDVM